MNKGLEALKAFEMFTTEDDYIIEKGTYKKVAVDKPFYKEKYNLIEKELKDKEKKLKTLEIIKEVLPINEDDFYEENGKCYFIGSEVDKDTFDLLKEVLL